MSFNPLETSIQQFYKRFTNNGDGGLFGDSAAYKMTQSHFFNVNMFFQPFYSSVLAMLAINTADPVGGQSFRFLVQSIEIPNMESIDSDEAFKNEFGYGSFPGRYVIPAENKFTINLLNTEFSLHEHALYHWLNETAAQEWQYADYAFTKANIIVQMLDQKELKPTVLYIFGGAFPSSIEMIKPDHAGGGQPTRAVSFQFNKMYIVPNVKAALGTFGL
jgi:hypothetical protein